jgi:thiamine-phosphate pyrophosphorylase
MRARTAASEAAMAAVSGASEEFGVPEFGIPGKAEMEADMAARLLRWARAVKARQARRHSGARMPPPLWLFTDAARLSDPLPAIAGLPRGLCGVVLRHDEATARATLGAAVARLCRARRLALVVAGDARLARQLGAGLHLRGGRLPGALRPRLRHGGWITSSAHGAADLRRARLAGAEAVFLSPAFPTASHPGGRALGAVRWAALARGAAPTRASAVPVPGLRVPEPRVPALGVPALRVLALGGIDALSAARLPWCCCAGAGAIGALLPPRHSVSQ